MDTTRRELFVLVAAGVASWALPRTSALPDDVHCAWCGRFQLPNHVSADGMAWHAYDGQVTIRVIEEAGMLRQVPWGSLPPKQRK